LNYCDLEKKQKICGIKEKREGGRYPLCRSVIWMERAKKEGREVRGGWMKPAGNAMMMKEPRPHSGLG
jgi:hypothetical protein